MNLFAYIFLAIALYPFFNLAYEMLGWFTTPLPPSPKRPVNNSPTVPPSVK